jgi:hypothetical protein
MHVVREEPPMKILLLAVFLSCVAGCRVPMNKKPSWAREPEPRNDARALVAADIPAEIDLIAGAGRGQLALLPTAKSPELVSSANAHAALGLPTLSSR